MIGNRKAVFFESYKERKIMENCNYNKVNESLYIWFTHLRDKDVHIQSLFSGIFKNEFNEGDTES